MNPATDLVSTNGYPIISGVSVIFDWGVNDRGQSIGIYSQADIVDIYGYRLNEELEYENVRTYYVDTRRTPVRGEPERLSEVPSSFVPIFLSMDWHERPRTHNSSTVEFSGACFYRLAERLCESLSEWGSSYGVYGHRVSRPVVVEGDQPFIRIKPFALNGPHADEYVRRMDKLGEDIGRAIGGYLKDRGEGIRR